jgi:hypothetical protein
LPEVDIRLVEQWILAGAIDDSAGSGAVNGDDAGAAPVATAVTIAPDDARPP